MHIGILGAGPLGGALTRLVIDHGHKVMISSRHPERLADMAAAIGCLRGTIEQAAAFGELCVLAVPFLALNELPIAILDGKIVIDAMNYYPERDGAIAVLETRSTTTSELVASRLTGARLVKAFNAILARDLPKDTRPPVPTGRRALPLAGNEPDAKRIVAALHETFGFEAFDTGTLADSWRFERAKPAYCIPLDRDGLARALDAATRDGELPHGSWRRDDTISATAQRLPLHELTTLACPLLGIDAAATHVREWTREGEAHGTLLGCWRTEIGRLGRLLVLRGFETRDALEAERARAWASEQPFGAGSDVAALSMESYAPFPFLPQIRTGDRGPVYEFRTYHLKPGGLPPTFAGWRQAIGPARTYSDHLVTNMHASDGVPRITHIWAFANLAERARLRADAYVDGVWPPPGGPEQIVEAMSTIALPESWSPLQ